MQFQARDSETWVQDSWLQGGVYVLIMRRKGKPRVAGAGDKDQPGDISISLTLSTNLWTLDVSQETGELYQGSKIKVIRIIII